MPKPYAPFGPSADGTCATQHLAPEPARLSAPAFSSPVSGSPAHVCVTVLRVCARVHTCPKAIARGAHGARRAIWHTLQTHAPAHTHPHTHTHDALGAQPRLRGRACRRGCRRDLDERIAGLDVVGLRKALLHERRRAPHLAAREQGGPRFRQGQEPHFQAEGAPGMPRSRARTRTHQPRPDPPAAWPAPRTCGCCARGSTASPPHRLPPAHRSHLPVSRPIRDAALRCAAPHRCQARHARRERVPTVAKHRQAHAITAAAVLPAPRRNPCARRPTGSMPYARRQGAGSQHPAPRLRVRGGAVAKCNCLTPPYGQFPNPKRTPSEFGGWRKKIARPVRNFPKTKN